VKVSDLAEKLALKPVAGEKGMDRTVKKGYCGDLLSEVMANAPEGSVWLTVQSHQNIVAVAVLKEMAAIIMTSEISPDPDTCEKADEENIPIFMWPESSFDLAVLIQKAGVDAGKKG